MGNINDKLAAFMRVVEIDMCYSYLMYFILITMSSFHEVPAILSFVLVIDTFLLTHAHCMPELTQK